MAKSVIDTNTTIINGRNVQVVTYDNGEVVQNDLGPAGNQDDAIANLSKTFENYGISSLASVIAGFVQQGYSSDTIALMLQDTPEYKQRFAGNAVRRNAGLPVLSPGEYLATERSYRAILESSGLPKGFYDSQDDFQKFIANDTSPTVLKQRVDAASGAIKNADPYYTQALQDMYGLSTGDMIAHALDPDKALPLIEKQAKAVEFGAAAARQGLSYSQGSSEALAQQSIAGVGSGVGAEQGFSSIASILPTTQQLGQIYGENYDQATAEQDVFGGLASAKRKRQKLGEMETSTFSGQSGLSAGALKSNKSGQF
jgi:hypothetical protein